MKREAIVFGKGMYFKEKKGCIEENFEIYAIVDNDVNYITFPDPIPVYTPDALKTLPSLPILIAVGRKFFVEVIYDLLGRGIDEKRILPLCLYGKPFDAGENILSNNGGKIFVKDNTVFMEIDGRSWMLKSSVDYVKVLDEWIQRNDLTFQAIRKMSLKPVSRKFGEEFGKPIDRFYIEEFLDTNKSLIFGDVMEIADSTYTDKYGHHVKCSYVLHVEGRGKSIKGNLATGEGLAENSIDCLICTQTVQFIYDLDGVAKNIYRILKTNGSALITCASISQIAMGGYRRWGDYWRFTPLSLKRIFSDVFGDENVEVNYYGNVKTAIGLLYGLSCSDLQPSDFEYRDEQYPIIISVLCKKKS